MVRVNSFLGCCQLETFGKFIAWFELIAAVVAAGGAIYGIVVGTKEQKNGGMFIGGGIAVLIISTSVFILCCVMIIGIKKRAPRKVRHFRNFCALSLAFVVLTTLFFIVKTLQPPVEEDDDEEEEEDIEGVESSSIAPIQVVPLKVTYKKVLISLGCTLVYQVYVLLCVHSLFKKLEDEKLTNVRSGPLSLFS